MKAKEGLARRALTASQLMIGDWVKMYNGKGEYLGNTQVNMVMLDLLEQEQSIMRLEPIPLTSELLERNGFERVQYPGCANPLYWMLEKYEEETDGLLYRIKAYDTPFRGMFMSINNPSCCETISFSKQIEFVHELQHAFQLCEIELEIKLED